MYYKQRRSLSQNFLHNRDLVRKILGKISIDKKDTVLEIGPGKGIITAELAQRARQVVAVEIDTQWVEYVKNHLVDMPNVILFNSDFLSYPLPASPYKLVANIPFAIEGQIVRKLLEADNPPMAMHVVVIRDVGKRWAGIPKSGLFSLCYGPWYKFGISHYFSRNDFVPRPKVESVLLSAVQRERPLLDWNDRKDYQTFLTRGFNGNKLKQSLSSVMTKNQFFEVTSTLGISLKSKPAKLSLEDWVKLYAVQRKGQ